jgi:hypothetical protein
MVGLIGLAQHHAIGWHASLWQGVAGHLEQRSCMAGKAEPIL